MNVWLCVDYEPIPCQDGGSRYLRYGTLANTLADIGHEVTWWTSDFDHTAKAHRQGPRRIKLRSNLTLQMLAGTGYRKNISLERIRHNRSVARSFRAVMEAMPVEGRPDVVMACLHTLEFSEAVAAFAAAHKVPLVVDVVDIWPEVYLRAFPPALKNMARRFLRSEFLRARHILESAQSITAVSQTYLDWALALCPQGPGKSNAMFPLGYDDTGVDDDAVRFESERLNLAYGMNSGALNLAFVGQLSHSYDLHTVVKAARLLYPSLGSKVKFFIAGDGIDRERLERAARDVPSIRFTGWLSHPSVIALLSRCTAGLVSYAKDATQSLPYKPFEYMAAGLVLLSCLPGELAELIANNGVGIQYVSGSPRSLAECIRALVNDPTGCARMRENARTLFETKYRSEMIYSRLASYLEGVVPGTAHQQSISLA